MQKKQILKKKEVVVKADESVRSREIMKIMKAAQDAEFDKLIVAGEPLSKKEQKQLQNKQRNENLEKHSSDLSQNTTQSDYNPISDEIPADE